MNYSNFYSHSSFDTFTITPPISVLCKHPGITHLNTYFYPSFIHYFMSYFCSSGKYLYPGNLRPNSVKRS